MSASTPIVPSATTMGCSNPGDPSEPPNPEQHASRWVFTTPPELGLVQMEDIHRTMRSVGDNASSDMGSEPSCPSVQVRHKAAAWISVLRRASQSKVIQRRTMTCPFRAAPRSPPLQLGDEAACATDGMSPCSGWLGWRLP